MNLQKLIIIVLLISFIFSCNSGTEKDTKIIKKQDSTLIKQDSTLIYQDSIFIENILEEISKIPKKNLPLNITSKELYKTDSVSNIYFSKTNLKNEPDHYKSYKALFSVPINKNMKILFFSVKLEFDKDYYITNFKYLILKNNNITAISAPLISEDETESASLVKLSILKKVNTAELDLFYTNDILSCLDTTNLGLTEVQKNDLLTDVYKRTINEQGEIVHEEKKVEEQNNKITVFEGEIGNYDAVMQLFRDEKTLNYYGKLFIKNNNSAVLIGQTYTPEMCFSKNASVFSDDNKLYGNIDFVNITGIYGHYIVKHNNKNDDLPVILKESQKSFEELIPNSVLSKIKNIDFKDYISRFAESKNDFSLNPKIFDNSGLNSLTQIDEKFKQKYINEDLFVSSYKGGNDSYTYNFGFVFDNGNDLTCILSVRISYLDAHEGQYRYLVIDYSYKGEIISFDIVDNISTKLNMRGYDAESDEPKDMFLQTEFGNEEMKRINFYIDIPSNIDIDSLIVYQQTGEDYTQTENLKTKIFSDKIFSYSHPHLYSFYLTGNFGCNNLFFEIKNKKGKIIYNKKIDMHCGE